MIYSKIISIHSVFGCSEEQLTIRHLNWAYCSPYPQAAMDGLLLFEEALTVLVFHELYRCVCSPKKRTYKWARLLCKATPLFMLSGTLAAGFTALSFKTDGSPWYDAPNVIWSVIAALFLLFFSLKMVLSLVKGLKFRNKLGSRDFFLFGLITITIVSQLTKVALKTAKFIVEYRAYDDHSRCLEGVADLIPSDSGDGANGPANILIGFLLCVKNLETKIKAMPYLSPVLGNLIESIFCMGIMIHRRLTMPK